MTSNSKKISNLITTIVFQLVGLDFGRSSHDLCTDYPQLYIVFYTEVWYTIIALDVELNLFDVRIVMKVQGAVIKEQGITFAVVVVKPRVIQNKIEADEALLAFHGLFGPIPVVLMAQDYSGRPTYYGRKDIARFLSNVPIQAIPWKEYTFN